MFIDTPPKPVRWADRTMTVLRQERLQACEKELAGLPQLSLFDAAVTDLDAENFYAASWYAREERDHSLHSIEGLRARVLQDLPASMLLLSPEEHDLMLRAVVLRGHLPVVHPESLFPALSLVRRGWGRLIRGAVVPVLELPPPILLGAIIALADENHRSSHERFASCIETVDNTLYLAGLLNADIVVRDVMQTLADTPAADHPMLCRIALRSAFDTCTDRSGSLFLAHSGLADPDALLRARRSAHDFWPVTRDAEDLSAAYESLTLLENPLYDQLYFLIQGLTRQECSPEDTVEDLIILIKQGADFASLREVLSSCLACMPTREMEAALQEMLDRIPRWASMQMGRLQ